MNLRRCRLVGAFGAAVCLSSFASDARAYHTPRVHITDNTAYTLHAKQVRVGLWKVQYGITDPFMVGTYIAPLVILAPNGHFKWRILETDNFTLSFGAGILYADTTWMQWVEDWLGPAQVLAAPAAVVGSYRFDDRFTLSLAPEWTLARVEGSLDEDALEGAGEGAGDNLQAVANFEWRLGRVVALVLDGRFCFVQKQELGGNATSNPDDFTQIDASASGDQNYQWNGGWSIGLATVLSWRIFNLRAGVGYGNFNVPVVNFVKDDKTIIPEFDLYWIW